MKTPEDEAFDELARKQGAWGGGFPAKRAMAADKLHWSERAALELCDYLECNDASMEAQCEAAAFIRKALAQPAQRPWVGLTDDELADIWYKESLDWMEFARAHEAALKEKNS
jgi:hypothetical protein